MLHRNSQGFTLLEVLISLMLLSYILLGFNAMEIYSLNKTYSIYYFHVAVEQVNSMIERLHLANIRSMLGEQESLWNVENKEILPEGKGEVSGSYPNYKISLRWKGSSGCLERNITL